MENESINAKFLQIKILVEDSWLLETLQQRGVPFLRASSSFAFVLQTE